MITGNNEWQVINCTCHFNTYDPTVGDDDDDEKKDTYDHDNDVYISDDAEKPYYPPSGHDDDDDDDKKKKKKNKKKKKKDKAPSVVVSDAPGFCDGGYVEFVVGLVFDHDEAMLYLYDVSSIMGLSDDSFHLESLYVRDNRETDVLVFFCAHEDVLRVAQTAQAIPQVLSGAGLRTQQVAFQNKDMDTITWDKWDRGTWTFIALSCDLVESGKGYMKDGVCVPCLASPGCSDAQCSVDGVPTCPSKRCVGGYAWDGFACQLCDTFYNTMTTATPAANILCTAAGCSNSRGLGCPTTLRLCQKKDSSEPLSASQWGAYACAVQGPSFGCVYGFGPYTRTATATTTSAFFGALETTESSVTVCAPCSEDTRYEALSCSGDVMSAQCAEVLYEGTAPSSYIQCMAGQCATGRSNQIQTISSPCVLDA
ncbi:hypothetical protein SARC_01871 [Sphaeroforma arctica JP610]|uniref:Uncharacterized protein n=1 Tax=Sphaeroforma arctica JP610 TaxID=667725 RepID=A0A0L0GAP1_9EUKA|nr:hypothetical protein SARC_01871 [Sphaeroforma arctica JP610]KNC85966.1 hypothetical protein SARC_01871 [Sphaeroforma arctica JP610]|eukprot:XP_014159868.1 hypothetical protein SARC_01871 [Sphaeroforma arctica JP610]